MTSFFVQFEKVGCGLLREAKWKEGEWAVLVEAKGMKKEYRSWKTEVNTAALTIISCHGLVANSLPIVSTLSVA